MSPLRVFCYELFDFVQGQFAGTGDAFHLHSRSRRADVWVESAAGVREKIDRDVLQFPVMLLQCLDALENQTIARERYEILVIDDHSPDNTPQRIAERPSVRFFRQAKNGGPSAARNVGIREAQGDWLLFLDDDILVAPNTLEMHLDAHREQPGETVAVLGVTRVAPGTPITPLMHYLLTSGKSPLIDSSKIPDPNNVPFGYFQTNTSVARTFLLRNGMFDEDLRFAYGEDTELAYRLQQVGLRIVLRPEIVVDHYGILSYQWILDKL